VPPHADIPVEPLRVPAEAVDAREPAAPRETEPPVAPMGTDGCPRDMAAVGAFCIDRYEAPNERGELPFALQTAYDGEAWCSERGKRLCSEDEWVRACQGPRARRYPYGDAYREDACNDDHDWIPVRWKALARWPRDVALDEATRLFQADMSGARAECVSEEGVYDLTGNVAEWVRRSTPSPRTGYDHVLKGCYWAGCFKEPHASCAFTNGVHPGTFRTYEAGFRCCSKRLAQPAGTAVTSPP
jgi:formylglycine-generating enzyme required for sulfatase activity